MNDTTDAAGTTAVLYVVVVVAAVLIGTVLAPIAWGAATQAGGDEKPAVAVVTIQGAITGENVDAISDDLREARQNESIEAVVLRVDSPGGGAAASEQLYMSVNRTAGEMPIVAAVTSYAASGGYYGIVPADAIYVMPGSVVGSVGVRASGWTAPGDVSDREIRSGPDKGAQTRDQVQEQVEIIHRTFLETVVRHRGDRLALDRSEIAHGKVYSGVRGVENGLADDTGDVNSAVARAAEESDEIDGEYEVHFFDPPSAGSGIIFERTDGGEVVVREDAFGYRGVDTVHYLALHGTVATNETEVTIDVSR